ncbi:PREDICTED: cytochrome P450 78A5 [Tarenaya hassleriana]|uniref:cytochrome P450 78A5 n=1 Tax=Tarenaya hassleriana TaxID=28532 RepID=UPI00053C4172|nr:PREDICTED: cytochrome P450 78A5 [Tarenaya hassleriana]
MSPETYLLFTNCTDALMSFEAILCFFFFVAVLSFSLSPGGLAWAWVGSKTQVQIPGPSGSIYAFSGSTPHRVLADLAKRLKATPLMAFSVGFSRFVISSEPDTAKEILNSSAFADRPVKESAYELLFHRAMGFAPYGEYWRNLRRISATHLFSPRRISSFGVVRREIGMEMVNKIKNFVSETVTGEVEVKKVIHFGSLNNVMMTVFGKSYDFDDKDGGNGFVLERLVSEGYELLGIFNWSDHLPVLGWFDFQGVRKRCKALVSEVNAFVGGIIEEHKVKRNHEDFDEDGSSTADFVDVLLGLQKKEKLSDSDMIAVLWEMIFRGTDTVAILLEWILARMVMHQDIQEKVHSEIASVTSNSTRPVSDSDIPNLPYLQAIVKETLRLHPPGPLLSWARLAIHDVHVGPTVVPGGTIAMVNMWAITHDPKIWTDPEEFKPERFMDGEDVSVMGSDLRLAPFGSGRRVCPGKAMGLATVHLWLAQLIQSFKWVKGSCDVELTEVLKLSMEMKKPLICKAVPRETHFA